MFFPILSSTAFREDSFRGSLEKYFILYPNISCATVHTPDESNLYHSFQVNQERSLQGLRLYQGSSTIFCCISLSMYLPSQGWMRSVTFLVEGVRNRNSLAPSSHDSQFRQLSCPLSCPLTRLLNRCQRSTSVPVSNQLRYFQITCSCVPENNSGALHLKKAPLWGEDISRQPRNRRAIAYEAPMRRGDLENIRIESNRHDRFRLSTSR